jgi:hypothetical protein
VLALVEKERDGFVWWKRFRNDMILMINPIYLEITENIFQKKEITENAI